MSKKQAAIERTLIDHAISATSERGARVALARKLEWDHGKVSRVLAGSQAMSLADAAQLALAIGRRLEVR